jgi:hypothetical protein
MKIGYRSGILVIGRLTIGFRPFNFFFYKNWYSLYRFKHVKEILNHKIRLIDIGAITIGWDVK